MFETELEFFVANQEQLVNQHRGKVLVLRGRHVEGAFNTPLEAYLTAEKEYGAGNYMLQPCEPGPGAYTVTIA